MTRQILCLVLVFSLACATTESEPNGEWAFEEPNPEDEEPVPADPPTSEPTPEEAEIAPPAEPVCTPPDLHNWDPDEFDLELFRFYSCSHPPDQNVLFSPALARLTLIEFAEEVGGAEGEEIAALLGFSDLFAASAAAAEYRASLLARRPVAAEGYIGYSQPVDYSIHDEHPDDLLEALSLEFFSPRCEANECDLIANNNRWSQTFLEDLPPAGDSFERGMVLRGQWENPTTRFVAVSNDFQVSAAESIPNFRVRQGIWNDAAWENFGAVELRLLGGEVSLILLKSDLAPDQVLEDLTSTVLSELVQRLHNSTPPQVPHLLLFPEFDLSQTLDLGEPLSLPQHIATTGRVSADPNGITFPSPLSIEYDYIPRTHTIGPRIRPQVFSFDRPFLFIIYDHPTESVLFLGRVARPVEHDPETFWDKWPF